MILNAPMAVDFLPAIHGAEYVLSCLTAGSPAAAAWQWEPPLLKILNVVMERHIFA